MTRGVSGPQIPEYSCQHRQKAAKSEVFSPERLLLGHCHWNRKESVRRGRHRRWERRRTQKSMHSHPSSTLLGESAGITPGHSVAIGDTAEA
jgi:hypothetical protein